MAFDKNTTNRNLDNDPQNRDPITGEPGAHPIGTALGATGAASAGAVLGAAAGPVGSIAGAVVGAIAGGIFGGLAGSGIAELVNPTEELAYWEQNYKTRPYVVKTDSFETYKPAYKQAYDSFSVNPNRSYEEARTDIQSSWQANKASSNLDWTRAEPAIKDAYDRTSNQYRTKLSNNSGAANSSSGSANSGARQSLSANASSYGAGTSGNIGSANNKGNNAA